MPDHVSAPTPDPSALSGAALGADPAALPPLTGSGPQSPSTADAPPVVQDEPGESAGAAPANDEALADRAAAEVFGSEDNAHNTHNTAGRITSFVASWERHKHEKTPAIWLADEFRRYPDLWTGGAGTGALRGIKDIVDSGHVDRIIGSSGAESLQGGAGNGPMYPS